MEFASTRNHFEQKYYKNFSVLTSTMPHHEDGEFSGENFRDETSGKSADGTVSLTCDEVAHYEEKKIQN